MTDIAKEKNREYEASLKEYWDYFSTMKTAVDNKTKEIARRMKARGVSPEEIAEMTDLSIEEVKML